MSIWQVTRGQHLRHRRWIDECVVYNDLSGDTHLLHADALAILLALQEAPRTLPELCRELCADDDDPAGLETGIAQLLNNLAQIELVEYRAC